MKKTISQKLNNNGFSLIELIVIMVIMVILSVAAVGSFVNSAGQKVTASTTIISKYLSDVMNYTMTGKYNNVNFESETGNETQTVKKAAELKIENRDGKFYISDGIGKEEQLKSGIDITYKTETGNTYDAATNALVLTFSRLNGSFNPITTSDRTEYVKYINIQATGNSKYSKVIRLYSKTGEYKIVDAQGSEDNEE